MRDFQEFINEKIAVSCSSAKENIDFVKLCCKNGFKLGRPDYMDRFDKNKLWTVGRIFKDEIFNDNNDKSFLSEYKIVQASEFLQPQATIEIFQSKQTVVCLKKENGKVIARGVAKCSKDDVFYFDYGSTIAFKRMLVDSKNKELMKDFEVPKSDDIQCDFTDAAPVEIKMLKDGTKIIKQDNYEVGDKVIFKRKSRPKAFSTKVTITSVKGELFKCSHVSAWLHKGRIKGKVIE